MRKLLFLYPLLLVGLIFGIGLKADYQETSKYQLIQPITVSAASQTTTITPIDGVWAMINQVNQDRILTDLRKLSGAEQICLQQGCYTITNRYIQNEGLQWAVNYVYAELTKLGYSVEIQDWSRSGYTSQNLIVRKPGLVVTGGEIYFVAHMDGVANSPAADDDASGVVSLLELARILRGHLYNNTVVLLFSTGEEVGTLGVRSYLDQLTSDELNAIKYVINVDMIGYDGNNDSVMELLNGSQPIGDLVQPMIDIISAYQLGLIPKIVSDCG